MPSNRKRAAHFLLLPELAYSPPNEAIVHALLAQGYEVDLFAPGHVDTTDYGPRVSAAHAEYGRRWLLANAFAPRWRQYQLFSGTSENPLAVVGVLSFLHRRASFALVDEIMSGSYRGDAPEHWKQLCRWAMRRADFCIVNDPVRIPLLRTYAGLKDAHQVMVYPGGYHHPPEPDIRHSLRLKWGAASDDLILGASGGFNLTSGSAWLIQALEHLPRLHAVIQPLGVDPLARFLLQHLAVREHVYLEEQRLDWKVAWAQAAAFDVGLAIYTNPAPQFQNMGVSSNRLCMYLAMGVPVIASRQPSFEFLEEYDCGVLVDTQEQFNAAVEKVRRDLDQMRANARRCYQEHVRALGRYDELRERLAQLS